MVTIYQKSLEVTSMASVIINRCIGYTIAESILLLCVLLLNVQVPEYAWGVCYNREL